MGLFQELKDLPEEELPSILPDPAKTKYNYGLFDIGNRTLPYFKTSHEDISYGALAIELPVALHLYNRARALSSPAEGRILEIGCVLPRYLPSWHREARAWERGDKRNRIFPHLCVDPRLDNPITGVIQRDLTTSGFQKGRYDLILSLSTLNLILDGESTFLTLNVKIDMMLQYVHRLREALSPVGVLMISIPWEYKFPRSIDLGESDRLIHHYLEAFHTDDNSNPDEAPNLIWKMNREGYGFAGNVWRYVDLLRSPNISPDEMNNPPSAKTVYFMLWGATEIW
jgi:hypothetical protein